MGDGHHQISSLLTLCTRSELEIEAKKVLNIATLLAVHFVPPYPWYCQSLILGITEKRKSLTTQHPITAFSSGSHLR
jgi:hypothetical protein